MKKRSLIFAMSAALAISGINAQKNETLFVYHKDGSITPLFFAEIDSINFSYRTLDGTTAQLPVVQEFCTPDSIYRFEIAAIDSVSFQAPPIIAPDGAINLSDELLPYIEGCVMEQDNLTLTLSESTPSYLIPRIGAILYQINSTEKLPAGFSGKVYQVDGKNMKCEPILPESIFESLAWTADYEIEAENVSASKPSIRKLQTRALVAEPSYPHYIEGVLIMTDELRDIPAGPEIPQIRGRISVTPRLRCHSGLYVINYFGKTLRMRRFFSEVVAKVDSKVEGRYNVGEEHADKNIGKITMNIPIGFGQECKLTYTGSMTLNGKMGLDYHLSGLCRSGVVSQIKYDPDEFDIHACITAKNKPMEINEHRLDASMDGKLKLTASLTLSLIQSGDSLKSMSNVFSYGSTLEGEALFLTSEIENAYSDNGLYKRITKTGVNAKPIESVALSAKYFYSTLKKAATGLTPPAELTFYAVPKLSNAQYNAQNSTISYEISGHPMEFSKSKLGAAVLHTSGSYTRSDSGFAWPEKKNSYSVAVTYNAKERDIIFPTVTLPRGNQILAAPQWPTVSNLLFPITSFGENDGVYLNSGTPMTGKRKSGNHVIFNSNPFPINFNNDK